MFAFPPNLVALESCNISTWFDLFWDDNRLLDLQQTNHTLFQEGHFNLNHSQIWRPRVLLRYNGEFYESEF